MIALNQPSLVLKLIPINQVDTVINNDDNSNSGNFGIESMKFNNMYYKMNDKSGAGSRSQA